VRSQRTMARLTAEKVSVKKGKGWSLEKTLGPASMH
jgi:hypothetical protein